MKTFFVENSTGTLLENKWVQSNLRKRKYSENTQSEIVCESSFIKYDIGTLFSNDLRINNTM